MTEVRLEGVSKSFGALHAVREVTLEIDQGELMAVLGPSGCGKTTLLRLLAGFYQPDAGTIRLGDRLIAQAGGGIPPEPGGEPQKLLFYVMPYIRGESLRRKLSQEKQLPIEQAIGIVRLTERLSSTNWSGPTCRTHRSG